MSVTRLYEACKEGDIDTVTLCLDQGIDVNTTQDDSWQRGGTALHVASQYGQERIVRLLVDRGADVDKVISHFSKRTALRGACEGTGNTGIVQTIVSIGANTQTKDNVGNTPLHWACRNTDNTETVKILLTAGADIHNTEIDGNTPLHLACMTTGNTETVKALLTAGADIHTTNNDGDTPLHQACQEENTEVVMILIENKADKSKTNKNGQSPLHLACYRHNNKTAECLIELGAEVNVTDVDGNTPLLSVIRSMEDEGLDEECTTLIQKMLEKGADVNSRDKRGRTALHLACYKDDYKMAEYLIEIGADVNVTDVGGDTPLLTVLQSRPGRGLDEEYTTLIQKMLEKGADVNSRYKHGRTALHLACYNNDYKTADCLIELGADVNVIDVDGDTPLLTVLQSRPGRGLDEECTTLIQKMLEKGADVNSRHKRGRTALHLACYNNDYKTADCLIELGADVNVIDVDGNTPLLSVLRRRQRSGLDEECTTLIQKMLEKGANVNSRDKRGRTPLHLACYNNDYKMAEYLIEIGADVNVTDVGGDTPLLTVLWSRLGRRLDEDCTTLIQKMLEKGADVNSRDKRGRTPLLLACDNDDYKIAEYLIELGADVNITDVDGNTPLLSVLRSRPGWGLDEECTTQIQKMLEKGVDVNHCNNNGETPLHLACATRDSDIILQTMISQRADVNVVDNDGRTPLDYSLRQATRERNKERIYSVIFQLLVKGCFIRNIFTAGQISSELKVLLHWAGDEKKDVCDVLTPQYEEAQVCLDTQIYLANNPQFVYSDTGFHNISQQLQSQSNSLQLKHVMDQLDNEKTFPSLKELVRSVLRRIWSSGGYSVLGRASALVGEIPHNLIQFLFMYEEACYGLPAFKDEIEYHFNGEHKITMHNGFGNRKQSYEQDSVPQLEDWTLLHNLMTTCQQINTPEWILANVVGACPQVIVEDISFPVSIQQELSLMQQRLNVSTPFNKEEKTITSTIERLLKSFLEMLSGRNNISWNLEPCGSFYLGNKIEEFDEVDYSAVLKSPDIRIEQIDTSQEYHVTIPIADLHGLGLHPREYITEGMKMYLKYEVRPEDPSNGKLFFRTIQSHTRGPGVCAQMAWMCRRGHTHDVGVDLSPTVLLEGLTLGDVWKAPIHFSKVPFSSVKQDLLTLPVYLVASTQMLWSTNDGQVTSKWKITYNNIKPLMFSCMDRTSPNIRRVFHLIKYIRQFLPRKLGFTLETEDIQGTWKDGSLISSYVLYNILLQEVLLHPTPEEWSNTNLVVRLRGALEAVSRWTYIDFFKDRREDSFTLFDLNDVQQNAVTEMMERQMDRMTDVLETLENNYSGELAMDGASTDQTLQQVNNKVSIVILIYYTLFTSLCQCTICIHIIYLSII